MNSNTDRQLVKQIRQIIKSEYEYWSTYNDQVSGGRKIKCMRNGYIPSQPELDRVQQAINQKLADASITVKSSGWEHCMSFRGPYVAFIVRI